MKILSNSEFEALPEDIKSGGGILRKDKNGNLINEYTRLLENGEIALLKSSPNKMSVYGLAKTICFAQLESETQSLYLEQLFQRIIPYIEEVEYLLSSQDSYIIRKYIKENIESICLHCIRDVNNPSFKCSDRKKKELKNQDLHKNIRNYIHAFLSKKYHIFEDYKMCHKAQINSKIFTEISEKYTSILNNFLYKYHKRLDIEFEDMKQELSVVLWNCIQKYKGENFARFSTYLRKALKNKINDMYRARSADKRVIDIFSKTCSFQSDDSYLSTEIDKVTYRCWQSAELESSQFSDISLSDLRNHTSLSVVHLLNFPSISSHSMFHFSPQHTNFHRYNRPKYYIGDKGERRFPTDTDTAKFYGLDNREGYITQDSMLGYPEGTLDGCSFPIRKHNNV